MCFGAYTGTVDSWRIRPPSLFIPCITHGDINVYGGYSAVLMQPLYNLV